MTLRPVKTSRTRSRPRLVVTSKVMLIVVVSPPLSVQRHLDADGGGAGALDHRLQDTCRSGATAADHGQLDQAEEGRPVGVGPALRRVGAGTGVLDGVEEGGLRRHLSALA